MALKAEDIERHIEQIRDERRESANTAKRVGGTMMEIFKYVAAVFEEFVQGKYLRKDIEDTAQEVETFLKGIKVDELFSWDKDGNIVVNQAVFNSFLSSPKFVSGFLEGLGWRLSPETVVNAAGVQEQRYTLEIDNVIVRGILRVFEMVISQLLGENDNRIFTAMLEVDHYDAATGKVYLDTMEGRYYNPFRKDDIIMVQQYNGMPSEENDYYVTKRYELVVTEVGSEGTGEDMLAWVKFKNFTSSMENATPENLIKKKDTFVRVDNLTDSERKGIITIMTVGKDTPYEDIIYGLKTDPDNALKGRLGNLKGIIHPLFGALQGFGELLMNLYATGDLILRRTGENIDTKFQVLENMFSTNYTKTEYELTDEDNYLHNGQFLTKYSDSDDAELIDGWDIDSDDDTAFWIDESGMPVLVNDNVSVGGNKRAIIERKDGRQLLRLTNIGITQANSLIKQPTTHKEYVKPTGSAKTDTDDDGNTSDNGLKTATDGSSKDVQDKLYVTMRIYALTQGTLTIGFTGCTDKEGLTNELASREQAISYSGKWQTVTFNGVWNGTGDFVIRYTGDCRIAFIAITDTALANLSKTVSTSIEQTAEAIKLLGYNDDKLHGQYTTLGRTVDAQGEKLEDWVSKAETKEQAEKNLETLRNEMKNLTTGEYYEQSTNPWQGWYSGTEYKHIGAIWKYTGTNSTDSYDNGKTFSLENGHVYRYNYFTAAGAANSRYAWDDITWLSGTATLVTQKADSWNVAAAAFNSNGTLKEMSGVTIKSYMTEQFSNYFDNDGKLLKKAGLFTSKDAAELFSKYFTYDESGNITGVQTGGLITTGDTTWLANNVKDADDNLLSEAKISAFVKKVERDDGTYDLESGVKIKADKISLEGLTTVNSYFKVNTDGSIEATNGKFSGTITATSGKIGPFSIGTEGLYNGDYTKWFTSEHANYVHIGYNSIWIEQSVGYFKAGDVANLKVGLGMGSDPTSSGNSDAYCASAMYIYRKMNSMDSIYRPAVQIISDNVVNRDIALRLEGGLQIYGGIMERGYSLEYKKSGDTNVLDLSFGTSFLLYTSLTTNPSFFFPSLTEIRHMLGITSTTQAFCVRVAITARKDTKGFYIATQYKAKEAKTQAEGGILVNNNGGEWEDSMRSMQAGDCAVFNLCYTTTTGYYAQIVSLQD